MNHTRNLRSLVFSDVGVLILLALARVALLLLNNPQYGWHRDELDMLDSARTLAWGYVSYPPVAPFLARVALTLFGPSLLGVRVLASVSMAAVMVLAGLTARELGGGRFAQVLAAVATGISPIQLLAGTLFSYSSFDCLWWVLTAYLVIRLLKSGDARWWLGIGLVFGLGMMTKYLFAVLITGVVIGVVITPARRFLRSPWLWAGALIAILLFLPNLIWQIQHGFISLEFMRAIHARDIRIGRAAGFFPEQLYFSANLVTIPLWVTGLVSYIFGDRGRKYRLLAWMYLVPLALLIILEGRSYYLAPAYPMLLAAGAVVTEAWLTRTSPSRSRLTRAALYGALALGGLAFAAIALPVAPVGSAWWDVASDLNGELREMIGWPDLVETVSEVYASLPEGERARTAIITRNYGEAGAIDLFGPAYGLPSAISGINSFWLRGYGDPPPETVIALGFQSHQAAAAFGRCEAAALVTNSYGVLNEELEDHPRIYVCRNLRRTWPEIWPTLKDFG